MNSSSPHADEACLERVRGARRKYGGNAKGSKLPFKRNRPFREAIQFQQTLIFLFPFPTALGKKTTHTTNQTSTTYATDHPLLRPLGSALEGVAEEPKHLWWDGAVVRGFDHEGWIGWYRICLVMGAMKGWDDLSRELWSLFLKGN